MEERHIITLSSINDIGPVTANRLIKAFGSAEAALGAGYDRLVSVGRVSEKRARSICEFNGHEKLESDIERVKSQGVKVVLKDSDEYPAALRDFHDAPLVLYMKGDIQEEDRFAVSVVGTRKPTAYGVAVTEKISAELASMGLTVVSGLARGVDTAAHRGALRAGGRSIGVMGSGIDVPYPAENRLMMEKMADSGAILSEFPPGTKPLRENFPRRNRIISALSLGVLVVEAQSDSGSLITAGYALEQGKDVFSVPGNINSLNSRGTNELIKKGAKVVTGARDIVEELAPVLKGFIKARKTDGRKVELNLTEEEKSLVGVMSGEPKHVNDISRECKMPSAQTLGVLLSLELKGVAGPVGGNRYYLKHG